MAWSALENVALHLVAYEPLEASGQPDHPDAVRFPLHSLGCRKGPVKSALKPANAEGRFPVGADIERNRSVLAGRIRDVRDPVGDNDANLVRTSLLGTSGAHHRVVKSDFH
ncbi:hypothetical protein D3C71_1616430 [compost metagenome]